ncbi:hypothetical protein M0R45_000945 [Rubus argutus]|uniref:Uncharacterized protein n=1 Tax=Rubus argutus TaxID=59490 RepID=A0AAW1VLV7_RUBAR
MGDRRTPRKRYHRGTKKTETGKEKEVIDIEKLQKLKQDVSAWTMNVLVDAISSSGLPISDTLDETEIKKEITNEMEATAAANDIFRNVAQIDATYIEKPDLLRFMDQEVVDHVWPLIDVANTGQVDKKTVIEWVVKVYNGRKTLVHTLTDTSKCVNQLNKLVISILLCLETLARIFLKLSCSYL